MATAPAAPVQAGPTCTERLYGHYDAYVSRVGDTVSAYNHLKITDEDGFLAKIAKVATTILTGLVLLPLLKLYDGAMYLKSFCVRSTPEEESGAGGVPPGYDPNVQYVHDPRRASGESKTAGTGTTDLTGVVETAKRSLAAKADGQE